MYWQKIYRGRLMEGRELNFRSFITMIFQKHSETEVLPIIMCVCAPTDIRCTTFRYATLPHFISLCLTVRSAKVTLRYIALRTNMSRYMMTWYDMCKCRCKYMNKSIDMYVHMFRLYYIYCISTYQSFVCLWAAGGQKNHDNLTSFQDKKVFQICLVSYKFSK